MAETQLASREALGWDQLEFKQASYYLGDIAHLVVPDFDNNTKWFRESERLDSAGDESDCRPWVGNGSILWNGEQISKVKREFVRDLLGLANQLLSNEFQVPLFGGPELYRDDVTHYVERAHSLLDRWNHSRGLVDPKDRRVVGALFQNVLLQLEEVRGKAQPMPELKNCSKSDVEKLL